MYTYIYIPTKQPYEQYVCAYHIWRAICIHVYIITKEPYVYAKEPYVYAKELCTYAKMNISQEIYEPYVCVIAHIWPYTYIYIYSQNIHIYVYTHHMRA